MERIIKLNVTMGESFQAYELPVDGDMNLLDFYFGVQKLLIEIYPKAKTYDFYTVDFKRLAIVSSNEEIYLSPEYQNLGAVIDLIEDDIDTIEVIALGNSTVKKVLEEEAQLASALNNYKI